MPCQILISLLVTNLYVMSYIWKHLVLKHIIIFKSLRNHSSIKMFYYYKNSTLVTVGSSASYRPVLFRLARLLFPAVLYCAAEISASVTIETVSSSQLVQWRSTVMTWLWEVAWRCLDAWHPWHSLRPVVYVGSSLMALSLLQLPSSHL